MNDREETLPILRRRADDERIVAEGEWKAGLKPTKPQEPCDHGLFGDEAEAARSSDGSAEPARQ